MNEGEASYRALFEHSLDGILLTAPDGGILAANPAACLMLGRTEVTLDTQAETVQVHLERLYSGIDVAETLSCVTGKWARRVTRDRVEFEDGQQVDLHNPPWPLVKPLVWW